MNTGIHPAGALSRLRSLVWPHAFPLDEMHLESNLVTLQLKLWTGKHISARDLLLSPKDLELFAELSTRASKDVPSSFGRRTRSISKHYNGYKAEEWKNFLLRDSCIILPSVVTAYDDLVKWRNLAQALWVVQRNEGLPSSDLPKVRKAIVDYIQYIERSVRSSVY